MGLSLSASSCRPFVCNGVEGAAGESAEGEKMGNSERKLFFDKARKIMGNLDDTNMNTHV